MTSRLRRLAAALAVVLAGCGTPPPGPSLTVAASADPSNRVLANVYAAGLRYYGTAAEVVEVPDTLAALDAGKAQVATGFTGRLLARLEPGSTARTPAVVYRAMVGALPEGIAAGDYAVAAEDKPALAVTDATAAAWDSRDLTAAVARCADLRVGALTGAPTPAVVGSCTLPAAREYGTARALFDALRSGAVTAVWTSTADTAVPDGTVVLTDRKPALVPAENVVALYRRNELGTMQLRAVNEIAGVLDTAALRDMLGRVSAGADPRTVAEEWLTANPLGR